MSNIDKESSPILTGDPEKKLLEREVVVAQLIEVNNRGSNPVIGKIYIEHWLLSTVLKRRK